LRFQAQFQNGGGLIFSPGSRTILQSGLALPLADNILDAMNQAGSASSPAAKTTARQFSFLIAICTALIVPGASPIFLGK
jgi:hypothetical protein